MRLTAVLVLLMATGPPPALLAQTPRGPEEMRLTGTLPRELREASGVAASRHYPGTLWVHNDSGHGPFIYAVDTTGAVHARFQLDGAGARDWEDISLGPCLEVADGPSCLYIADTGDNGSRRQTTSIYVVPEPDPLSGVRTVRAREIRLRLIRGPTDIEALAVSPAGQAVLVSKGREGRVFVFGFGLEEARIAAETGRPLELRTTGTLNLPARRSFANLVTGAAFSPNGDRLVVRTYQTLFFYQFEGTLPGHVGPPCHLGAAEPQGEAVAFLDDARLVVVSEQLSTSPATIYVLRCR